MPRSVSAWMLERLQSPATRPIYIAQINHSGATEYLSASGAVTYDGQVYTAGGMNIRSVVNSESARIMLPATAQRISEVQGSTYRRGVCAIYLIPGLPDDTLTYTAAQGMLLIDGRIESSSFSSEAVNVSVINKYLTGRLGPGYICNEVASYIPAPGSSITINGETVSYEQWLKTTAVLKGLS